MHSPCLKARCLFDYPCSCIWHEKHDDANGKFIANVVSILVVSDKMQANSFSDEIRTVKN